MERAEQLVGYRRESADPPYLHPDYVSTRTRAPSRPLVPLAHTLSEVTVPSMATSASVRQITT